MVYLFSYANPLLLLFSTAFIVIHGYRRNSVDEENGLLGYRLDDGTNVHDKRDPDKNFMWIGPRLGRRKRSDEGNAVLPENRPKNGPTVVEFLQDSPWAFVALKGGLSRPPVGPLPVGASPKAMYLLAGGKRRTVNFIPRLGRDSDEEYDSAMDSPYMKSSSRSENQVVGPFGGGNNFTPRLGRYAGLLNRERYGSF